jgi:hypothetical protein
VVKSAVIKKTRRDDIIQAVGVMMILTLFKKKPRRGDIAQAGV